MKLYQIVLLVFLIVSASCVKNKKGVPVTNPMPSNIKSFEVTEVIQTSKYTYMKVNENSAERWVAVTRMEAAKGDKLYYDSELQMTNFHSKELDRNFETIYFINTVSTNPIAGHSSAASDPMVAAHSGKKQAQQNNTISVEKAENEITIAQIFENPSKFSNKEIEIRGIVVKVNKQVMGKNWIHIQDGSSFNNRFDLTITSQDLPSVNDDVTFKGTIFLNKDFGAGYFYDVIMENSVMVNKQTVTL
uniref:hypothetical protein n=1 Tax=uncultured Draconibacterium sp. TaxID=1573823 RepID=UPI0032178A1A